jgi:4Fe-4S iron-sulfur cluster binding domain/DR2241 stabilising domain
MVAMTNPALEKFVAQIGSELLLAQVLITCNGRGYELRHVADRSAPQQQLRLIELPELRTLAQFTAGESFRPLKSAPNLQRGWRVLLSDDDQLATALHHLYPGAIADWFAAQAQTPPVTHFRDFTNRQTGMYRITASLSDEQAAEAIRAGCHQQFCLKRRLWTVAGLAADPPAEKSLIPCLEPCAVLLEFVRSAVRMRQAEKLDLTCAEAASIPLALEALLKQPAANEREADFSSPANGRRLQLLLEKLRPLLKERTVADPE